jgi:predicted nucleotidyltransferase
MKNEVQAWAKNVKRALGTNLTGVILYGSAARGDHVPARSDLNLVLVFKKIDLVQIAKINTLIPRRIRKRLPRLVFWTQKEIKNAWDVFPLEFSDIAANHRCLAGADPFRKRKIDTKRLRYQLEFELRAKLLKLREDWLAINRDTYAQERYLIKAGTSFDYLIGRAQAVLGKKGVTAPDLFAKIKRLKKKEIRLKRAELQDLFFHLHETVEAVIGKIDAV